MARTGTSSRTVPRSVGWSSLLRLGAEDEAAWASAKALLVGDLAVPRASDLGLEPEVRHALIRNGDLVRIDDDLVLLPDQVAETTSGLVSLPQAFTVATSEIISVSLGGMRCRWSSGLTERAGPNGPAMCGRSGHHTEVLLAMLRLGEATPDAVEGSRIVMA